MAVKSTIGAPISIAIPELRFTNAPYTQDDREKRWSVTPQPCR
jgi:hypothetical protein